MKTKQLVFPLIFFLLGMIATIFGALFKIQHWPYGSQLLTIGSFLEVLGLVVLIVILIKYYFRN